MSQVLRAETTSQMFRELVDRAVDHQQVSPSPDSVRYLVQLLDAFVHWDPLHEESETEHSEDSCADKAIAIACGETG